MSGMEMAAFAAISGGAKILAARSEAKGLAAQATQTRVEARSEALKYKQQGVAVLDNILKTDANIMARAGAGVVDPFSGSAMALRFGALAKGADEFYMTKEGATIVTATGEAQANEFLRQGKAGMQAAFLSAVAGVGEAQYMQSTLGSA